MIGRILDKAVAAVSPVAGLKRQAARMALDLRAYDGAAGADRFGSWRGSRRSANAEIGAAGPLLTARARDLGRNSPIGKRAKDVLSSQMVATGHHPRLSGVNPQIRRPLIENWKSFCKNSDPECQQTFHGQMRLACAGMVEGGDTLIEWFDSDSDHDGAPMQCRVLEGDWLDSSKSGPGEDGGWIIQGVELNARGCRVAYHLHGAHPGDIWTGKSTHPTRRVEAKYIDHLYDISRPGQMRGVSWFAPVIATLRDRDDYMDALRQFAKLQAAITLIVRNSSAPSVGTAKMGATQGGPSVATMTDPTGKAIESVTGGSIVYADGAETVEKTDAPGLSESTGPVRIWDHDIAAGLGMYHAQLTGDLSGVNYSSLREGKLGFYALLDVWQTEIVQTKYDRAWARVQDAHALLGTGPRAWVMPEWARPPRPWVDPLKDVQALRLELATLLRTHTDAIAERGGDAESLFEEVAEGVETLSKLGIDFNPLALATPLAGTVTEEQKDEKDAA